jgi:hypothetical protein
MSPSCRDQWWLDPVVSGQCAAFKEYMLAEDFKACFGKQGK